MRGAKTVIVQTNLMTINRLSMTFSSPNELVCKILLILSIQKIWL
jgi:hypothetical protein